MHAFINFISSSASLLAVINTRQYVYVITSRPRCFLSSHILQWKWLSFHKCLSLHPFYNTFVLKWL